MGDDAGRAVGNARIYPQRTMPSILRVVDRWPGVEGEYFATTIQSTGQMYFSRHEPRAGQCQSP